MRYILTLIAASGLLVACKNSSKSSDQSVKFFKTARTAQDFPTAITALTMIAAQDSAANPWVYDSLAFYHYFYNNIPGMVKNPATALHFCNEGLKLNTNNDFLTELKGKLVLNMGKDTQALELFTGLWNKTKDYTYLWEMTFIELARGNNRFADSMIKMVSASNTQVATQKVRFTHIDVPMTESVDPRAAFLFFRALMKNNENKFNESAEILKQSLQIAPDFYLARKGMYELQQAMSGKGMPRQ
jgi:hypothetical protein